MLRGTWLKDPRGDGQRLGNPDNQPGLKGGTMMAITGGPGGAFRVCGRAGAGIDFLENLSGRKRRSHFADSTLSNKDPRCHPQQPGVIATDVS